MTSCWLRSIVSYRLQLSGHILKTRAASSTFYQSDEACLGSLSDLVGSGAIVFFQASTFSSDLFTPARFLLCHLSRCSDDIFWASLSYAHPSQRSSWPRAGTYQRNSFTANARSSQDSCRLGAVASLLLCSLLLGAASH
jgi:hypothetical protein